MTLEDERSSENEMTEVEPQGNAFEGIAIEHTEEDSIQGHVVNSSLGLPEPNVIHRKLTSFVGFANLPQQWQKKSIKQGFSLNLLVVGEKGLGKSTLVNTLFNTDVYDTSASHAKSDIPTSVSIQTESAEIVEGDVRLSLTVLSTPGFGDAINNNDAWRPIVEAIDQRFDKYLEEENRVNRTSIRDERIHACIYFIQPTGHSLRSLDIDAMKQLHKKVNLVPVIAKSDTLTHEEVRAFKERIMADIRYQQIDIFLPPIYDNDDDEAKSESRDINACVPFAVVGSADEVTNSQGVTVRGRSYPWGVVEVDNEDHCDFVKLRQLIIRNHLEELRERTANELYENYRTEKLQGMGIQQDYSVFKEVNPTTRMEQDRAAHQMRLDKMEQDMKSVFQQKVHEKEQKLRESEAQLFTRHRQLKDQLDSQRAELEKRKIKLEQMRPQVDEKKRKNFFG